MLYDYLKDSFNLDLILTDNCILYLKGKIKYDDLDFIDKILLSKFYRLYKLSVSKDVKI